MKLITLLFTLLFNQESYLVKQGGVEVPLADLDAYVYLLQNERRGGFAVQKQQIEQNIFTLLNINIVYQHILNSELKDLKRFQQVITKVNSDEWIPEPVFIDRLDVDEEAIKQSVKSYVIKREYYRTLLAYLEETTTEEKLNNRALEYYMVNKSEFVIPEIRDLSVIVLDSNQADPQALIQELQGADQTVFQAKALDISTDPSKSSNEGHWGEFKSTQFQYAFKNKVFNAPVGLIPEVLSDRGVDYIIRVNGIKPKKQGSFEESKQEIFKALRSQTVMRKFQSIINEKATQEVEVNPELVAHVFERYKVFIEE